MITVVELQTFRSFCKQHLDDSEVVEIVNYLANHPKSGTVIQGTGGLRKLRWATKTKGKSGGYRVIYYYHNHDVPLFLIAGFAKNKMENIGHDAKNQYKKRLSLLVKEYNHE